MFLQDFVKNLIANPASTAFFEKIFYGLIWTDLRKRLGADKTEKLEKINCLDFKKKMIVK